MQCLMDLNAQYSDTRPDDFLAVIGKILHFFHRIKQSQTTRLRKNGINFGSVEASLSLQAAESAVPTGFPNMSAGGRISYGVNERDGFMHY